MFARLRQFPVPSPLLGTQAILQLGVLAGGDPVELSAQLPPTRDPVLRHTALVERSEQRTPRLRRVRAVSEPAVPEQPCDFLKRPPHALIGLPQAHFAQTRRVH